MIQCVLVLSLWTTCGTHLSMWETLQLIKEFSYFEETIDIELALTGPSHGLPS